MSLHYSAFIAFCLFGAILSVIRVFLTGSTELGGLVWNLILALIPYFFALIAIKRSGILHRIFFLLWLLFFPNSLYIWTDFIHLGKDGEILHFDIVYIGVMAIAGLISGFASLEMLHAYWNRHYHRTKAWILISLVMLVSLFGVYLGRFLRFNSWDIMHEPMNLMREIISLLLHPNTPVSIGDPLRTAGHYLYAGGSMNVYGFIVLYFGFYMLLYVFLYHVKSSSR